MFLYIRFQDFTRLKSISFLKNLGYVRHSKPRYIVKMANENFETQVQVWKDFAERVEVDVQGLDDNSVLGEVYIEYFSRQKRLCRAGKTLAIFWGVAVACVFIPMLHFVLVPLFFILGLVLGLKTFRQTSIVLGGRSPCPRCHKELAIVRSPDQWPLRDLCSSCHNAVRIFKKQN